MAKWLVIALSGIFGFVVPASATETQIECYDLKARGKAVDQLPTVIPPEEKEDRIIISWPWFVALKVTRVLDGEGSKGVIPVLAVLHGGLGTKKRTYYLRSNTIGSYNLIRSSNEDALERCPLDTAPAEPLMWDLSDKAIEEYRHEAEEKRERDYADDED